jgi:hypothetical protein
MPSGTRKLFSILHSNLGSEASDKNINKGSSTPVGSAGSHIYEELEARGTLPDGQ